MCGGGVSAVRRFKPEELLGGLNAVERKNAPEYLWLEGDRSLLRPRPRVSIVGTRKPSPEGLKRAARLARELVAHDVVVVSGLARGLDTAAHRSCIENGGRTIAVLGGPLESVYPPENAGLQRVIAAEHLVVSQFAPGNRIRPTNFPRRNRTMALLTDATVIVEAGEGSGTLSQGWEALRLGRALFIMKSVAEDRALLWPAEMLGYGAEVLSGSQELLDRLPLGLDESVSLAL
jgi:DNA processing protein